MSWSSKLERDEIVVYNYNNAAIRICIDDQGDSGIIGRIYSPLLVEPIVFSDIGNMVIQVEDFLDTVGFPCAFQRLRSFIPEDKQSKRGFKMAAAPVSVSEMHGNLLDFDLRITSRQNASWQGFMGYNGERIRFRSALELIKLIYPLLVDRTEVA